MSLRSSAQLMTLQDVYESIRRENSQDRPYGGFHSFRRDLNDFENRIDVPFEIRKMIERIRPLNEGTQLSLDDARLIVEHLPLSKGGGRKILVIQSHSGSPVGLSSPRLFTRAEAFQLTGLTVSQLMKLESDRLIVPVQSGTRFAYSWRQLIALCAIRRLNCSRQCKARIIESAVIQLEDESRDFAGSYLMAYGEKAHWIAKDRVLDCVLKATQKDQGQTLNLISYDALVGSLETLQSAISAA